VRRALGAGVPFLVSGRAVNLLAKPIDDVEVAADFNTVMAAFRAKGVLPSTPVARVTEQAGRTQTG
jgi:hypothetical protein